MYVQVVFYLEEVRLIRMQYVCVFSCSLTWSSSCTIEAGISLLRILVNMVDPDILFVSLGAAP